MNGFTGKRGPRLRNLCGEPPVRPDEVNHAAQSDLVCFRPVSLACRARRQRWAVAFVVCQAIGLTGNGAAVDYIQLYQGDKNTLAASLDRIQKTATAIIAAITDQAAE